MSEPLLRTESLSRRFGGLRAVERVSLSVGADEVLGLIGPNGAGKTTLFNLLGGQLRPDSGVIRFDGRDTARLPPHLVCRRGIARTFQVPRTFAELTVLESVLVGARFGRAGRGASRFGARRARELAGDVLERTGLADRREKQAGSLNLSERKRLDLARALATRPRLLLVDEVAAGLNPTEVRKVVRLLRDIHESGVALVYVEHVMEAVLELSDRVHVLDHGETITCGPPTEIVRDPRVVAAYLGREME